MLELLLSTIMSKGDLENSVQAMIDIKLEDYVVINITITGQFPSKIEFYKYTCEECKKISIHEVRNALENAIEINIH